MAGIDTLLQKKLVIFSGKGGVGKSTLSAAFALFAARRKKNVLLVEIDPRLTIPGLFGRTDIAPYREVELSPRMTYLNIDPLMALQEYLAMKLRFKRVFDRLLNSKIYQVFTQASPGLREIVTLGKIWDIVENGGYDLLVLDAPATGHLLPFLGVPRVVISALRVGPIVSEARKIDDLLSDTRRTILNIVTIPEDMAVTEALEIWADVIDGRAVAPGHVFINQVIPEAFTPGESSLLAAVPPGSRHRVLLEGVHSLERIIAYQRRQISRLEEAIPRKKLFIVPYQFSTLHGRDEVSAISRDLE